MGLLDAHGGKEVHAVLREIVNGIRRLALVNILSGITLIVSDGANTVTEQRPKKVELMPIGLAAVNKDQRVSISAFLIANASSIDRYSGHTPHLRLFQTRWHIRARQIGRASCRERVCQYV